MLSTTSLPVAMPFLHTPGCTPCARAVAAPSRDFGERISALLRELDEALTPQRRIVHAGDVIHRAGDPFVNLHVLGSGFCKIVSLSADGREQVVGLKLRGDWLGFDGIASGHHACDAIAMDTGEIRTVRYDQLLAACANRPGLLAAVHQAMSHEMTRGRDSLMSICTLPADARVADFLRRLAESLARRGLRNDTINLHLTRAEIGNYLGMTLESVSRALSRLARDGVIGFAEKGRRDLCIPSVAALGDFVQRSLMPVPARAPALLQ